MPDRKSWLSIALTLIAGVAILAGAAEVWSRNAGTAAAAKPVATDIPGPRVWYAPDQYPQLTLPDGEHKTIRSVLNIKEKLRYGEFVWNDQYIPRGPMWIRVDLDRQLISAFRGGHEIGTAVILYGATSKQTPNGIFPILQKDADYHSITYDAPMPYMLRLTQDGVAIHGSDVRKGAATHGCIGVPIGFARRLFREMSVGDKVVVVGAPT